MSTPPLPVSGGGATGDARVDEALTALESVPLADLDGTIEAAEQLHEILQNRLRDARAD